MKNCCVLDKIYQWLKKIETRDMKNKNNIGGQIPQINHIFIG